MKRHLIAALVIVLLLNLTGCGINPKDYPWEVTKSSQDIQNIDENIILQVAEDSITAKGASCTVYNHSDEEISFGSDYFIQLKNRNTWYDIHLDRMDFTLELYVIPANDELTFNLNWSYNYGELPVGEYRLVKEYKKADETSFIFCPFELE